MATTDARTSVGSDPGTGLVYDGFISYSHAADDLLAPRLQAGLQRFAKPWWKRRALRISRDESSLSANPHLWSSITEALSESDWFILLPSPDAARTRRAQAIGGSLPFEQQSGASLNLAARPRCGTPERHRFPCLPARRCHPTWSPYREAS